MNYQLPLLLTIILSVAYIPQIDGFTAGQPAPWTPPLNDNPNLKLKDVYIIRRPSKKCSSAVATTDIDVMDDLSEDVIDDEAKNDKPLSNIDVTSRDILHDAIGTFAEVSTRSTITPEPSTIRSSIGPLWKMTRPGNFFGVVCFHFLGIYRCLSDLNLASTQTLIATALKPSMLATLASLILICSTSMIVNDYYDGRSGLDSYKLSKPLSDASVATRSHYKPLASNEVTYPVTKRFISYLYTAVLVSATVLPGVTARLSVVTASMVTFWYTQHLKPKTWLKNVACASLIALAPFTSGSAALHLVAKESLNVPVLSLALRQMGCLTLALFSGIMGREIMMDIVDYKADKASNVLTVPVQYGRRFASKVGLTFMVIASGLTIIEPLVQLLTSGLSVGMVFGSSGGLSMITTALKVPALRRLCIAAIASAWLILRAFQVMKTEGMNEAVMDRTIEESKVSVLLVLASFL